MKKLGLGIAMAAALMLTVAPAMQQVRAAAANKTLLQGFSEELGKIGKPEEKAKPAKKAKAKKAAVKKDDKKMDDKKKDDKKK